MKNQLETLSKRFRCDDDCYKYLAGIKWPNEKFVCRRCGNTTYHHGRSPYSRRCNKCKRDESATSGTMFDKLKFPILTAFNIVLTLATQNTEISSSKLAKIYGIQPKTCLEFRYKVQQAMRNTVQRPLKDAVGLGILKLARQQRGYWWKQKKPERLIAIVAEIKGTRVNRAFALDMKEDKASFIVPFIKRYVHPEAHIFIIERTGFKQLKREHKLMTFVEKMDLLSKHVDMLSNHLNSENSNYSLRHLQGYLDEFHFRFNHQQNIHRNFDMVMRIMVRGKCDDNK